MGQKHPSVHWSIPPGERRGSQETAVCAPWLDGEGPGQFAFRVEARDVVASRALGIFGTTRIRPSLCQWRPGYRPSQSNILTLAQSECKRVLEEIENDA